MADEDGAANEAAARNRALTRGRSLPSYCLFDETSVGPRTRWPAWWSTQWAAEWERMARRADELGRAPRGRRGRGSRKKMTVKINLY
jgi:hypothetical protein